MLILYFYMCPYMLLFMVCMQVDPEVCTLKQNALLVHRVGHVYDVNIKLEACNSNSQANDA